MEMWQLKLNTQWTRANGILPWKKCIFNAGVQKTIQGDSVVERNMEQGETVIPVS